MDTMNKEAAQRTDNTRQQPDGPRRAATNLFRRYTIALFAASLLVASGVLVLAAAIDPLWYWRGNTITGENFAFNERFSKLNHFLRNSKDYDCLILGSSRVTLLDHTKITGYRCANLAFSAGVVTEFVAYARYIKAQGFSPKLLIVGVDAFNFWRDMKMRLPDFVERGEPPPGWLRASFSASVLRFSLTTLWGASPMARAYDVKFVGQVDEDAPIYDPPEPAELMAKPFDFVASRRHMFGELRRVFPEARAIAYVPPVSAWRAVEELYLTNHIEQYLAAIEEIADEFEVLYDFSAPSQATMRAENTYDGGHFGAAVNSKIAEVLQGSGGDFGIEVRAMSLAEYRRTYLDAIANFVEHIENDGYSGE